LEATASLRYAIDRFLDYANHRPSVRTYDIRACRLKAIDYFTFHEVPLKICGDKVNAPDIAPIACGIGKKATRGGVPQGFGERLIIINSFLQCATLYT